MSDDSTTVRRILVLMGHQNSRDGELSPVAKSRCRKAIELLDDDQHLFCLPTGSFDAHFNTSSRAHGLHITEYLVKNGITRDRILPYTDSSNTFEDALCCRKVAVDFSAQNLIVVTSEFHMERVKYIFHRMFPEMKLSFHEAASIENHNPQRDKQESRKLEKLQKEWVSGPLYTKNRDFPREVYENADREHKHYDNLSYFTVLAIVISSVFPHVSTFSSLGENLYWLPFTLSVLMIGIFYRIYWRMAKTGDVARALMRWIELGFGKPGLVTNYRRQQFARTSGPLKGAMAARWILSIFSKTKTIRVLVLILTIIFITLQSLVIYFSFANPFPAKGAIEMRTYTLEKPNSLFSSAPVTLLKPNL